MFDSAAGVGRRVCGKVRTTETFAAFAAHHGFAFSFCNPNAEHEKGNVESKVRFVRTNLFAPAPRLWRIETFNERPLDRRYALSKERYLKGENEKRLFMETANAARLRAVSELVEHEMGVRERSKRARLYSRARFPQVKSFDGYDFSQVVLPDGYGVEELKSLSFVDAAQDFVFHGQTGRGRTHPAIAIGNACVMADKTVRFYTAAELTLSLSKAIRGHALDAMMKDILRNDLIILDEFGYVPLDVEKRAVAVPGGIELLREAKHDLHDRYRVLETGGDSPRRRQARIGHDRQNRPSWETSGVQRGEP